MTLEQLKKERVMALFIRDLCLPEGKEKYLNGLIDYVFNAGHIQGEYVERKASITRRYGDAA